MIRWTLFSTLAAGIFYGLYCLLLRRDRWLQLSLVYLISIMPFSMALPFLQLPHSVADGMAATPALQVLQLDEITVTPGGAMDSALDLFPTIWMFGMALMAAYLTFLLVTQVIHIIVLRHRHPVYTAKDGFDIPSRAKLVLLDDDTAPYSFFNHIVVGTRDLCDEELRCILAHESYHVVNFHSIDLLFARLMCCLAWYNPFAWLIMREIRAMHEFQADAAVVAHCGNKEYIRLLYRQATGVGYGHITNNFQSINIKKRIAMMNRKKTRFGAWKLLAALPVAAMLMLVGCKPAATSDADETVTNTVVSNDAGGDITTEVDVDPEFIGGVEGLYRYLAESVKYPEQAKEQNLEGRVFAKFVIETDGSVSNVEIVRGIGGGCDEEVLRVVEAMPKWKPAEKDGHAVRTHYVIPVYFKLK